MTEEKAPKSPLKELISSLDVAYAQKSIDTLNVHWYPEDRSAENSLFLSIDEGSNSSGVEKLIGMIKTAFEAENLGYTYNFNKENDSYNLSFEFYSNVKDEPAEKSLVGTMKVFVDPYTLPKATMRMRVRRYFRNLFHKWANRL